MPSDDLRKKIEALNKRPLHNVPDPASEEAPELRGLRRKLQRQSARSSEAVATSPSLHTATPASEVQPLRYSRTLPVSSARSTTPGQSDSEPAITLEEAVKGVVTAAPDGPGFYLVEQFADELEPSACETCANFRMLTGHPDGEAAARLAAVCGEPRIDPHDIVFLDLETTGLSMTPVFLIGTMEFVNGRFVFKQYLARDYSEEISILSAFSERLKQAKMIVTFNGKSFDMPFLANRAVANGVRLAQCRSHLDLLHEARRAYARQLPNCKLQTLERMVCGRTRDDDIPGSEIPQAYHDFVRTGNARKIGLILLHNLYDLLTMADLMHCMWRRS